jgi:hypothetical protein
VSRFCMWMTRLCQIVRTILLFFSKSNQISIRFFECGYSAGASSPFCHDF